MIEANPHALARKRARDVHAQGFVSKVRLRKTRAHFVESRALDIELVAQVKLLVCHVPGTSGRLGAPRPGFGRGAVRDREVGHCDGALQGGGRLGTGQGARTARKLHVHFARPRNRGHNAHAEGCMDHALAGQIGFPRRVAARRFCWIEVGYLWCRNA